MLKLSLLSAGVAVSCGWAVVPAPAAASAARTVTPRMVDMDTVVGVGIALAGVGGGVGLIAFTENAGKRNEDAANAQPCVECQGVKVVDCPVCKGEGRDAFASLVAGVNEMAGGEVGAPATASLVEVDDWER